jgi:hypothetical protein
MKCIGSAHKEEFGHVCHSCKSSLHSRHVVIIGLISCSKCSWNSAVKEVCTKLALKSGGPKSHNTAVIVRNFGDPLNEHAQWPPLASAILNHSDSHLLQCTEE